MKDHGHTDTNLLCTDIVINRAFNSNMYFQHVVFKIVVCKIIVSLAIFFTARYKNFNHGHISLLNVV